MVLLKNTMRFGILAFINILLSNQLTVQQYNGVCMRLFFHSIQLVTYRKLNEKRTYTYLLTPLHCWTIWKIRLLCLKGILARLYDALDE